MNSGVSHEVILADGRGTPIIPVDEGNTSQGLTLNRRAASAQTILQAPIPSEPVAQFALPEFTITARTRPRLLVSEARPTSTGAATTRFFVNSAAAVVRRSATISARSGFPLALIAAAIAENLNPWGRKIGPDPLIRGA